LRLHYSRTNNIKNPDDPACVVDNRTPNIYTDINTVTHAHRCITGNTNVASTTGCSRFAASVDEFPWASGLPGKWDLCLLRTCGFWLSQPE